MIVRLNHQPSGGPCWAAEVTGRGEKYPYAQKFLDAVTRDRSSSGKTGSNAYELLPGRLYRLRASWQNGDRFVRVEAREGAEVLVELTAKDVADTIARMENVAR